MVSWPAPPSLPRLPPALNTDVLTTSSPSSAWNSNTPACVIVLTAFLDVRVVWVGIGRTSARPGHGDAVGASAYARDIIRKKQ
jgi:hypothetical protein